MNSVSGQLENKDVIGAEATTSEPSSAEHRGCKWSLSGSKSGEGCCEDDEKAVGDCSSDDAAFEEATEVFSRGQEDRGDQDNVGGLPSVSSLPSSSSSPTAAAIGNSEKKLDDCNSNADKPIAHNCCNNNNTSNNNNDDTNVNNNDPLSAILRRRGHPVNKILSPLFSSSSSSSHSFFPSSTHRTSSSLSSISEAEMLTMMETMGEGEILSALPPCDCDDCLLNGPSSPNVVPPDQRKLTRVSPGFFFLVITVRYYRHITGG